MPSSFMLPSSILKESDVQIVGVVEHIRSLALAGAQLVGEDAGAEYVQMDRKRPLETLNRWLISGAVLLFACSPHSSRRDKLVAARIWCIMSNAIVVCM